MRFFSSASFAIAYALFSTAVALPASESHSKFGSGHADTSPMPSLVARTYHPRLNTQDSPIPWVSLARRGLGNPNENSEDSEEAGASGGKDYPEDDDAKDNDSETTDESDVVQLVVPGRKSLSFLSVKGLQKMAGSVKKAIGGAQQSSSVKTGAKQSTSPKEPEVIAIKSLSEKIGPSDARYFTQSLQKSRPMVPWLKALKKEIMDNISSNFPKEESAQLSEFVKSHTSVVLRELKSHLKIVNDAMINIIDNDGVAAKERENVHASFVTLVPYLQTHMGDLLSGLRLQLGSINLLDRYEQQNGKVLKFLEEGLAGYGSNA
ncbi:hypothetical protein BASA62_006969 [Batrachochytrium salamandrivorans]|nr:hypothetical protein BASA62_006969 [Batrachochytrium salamandrivorans]